MANQITIDIGAAANDGTGDPLRTAFNYVNNNFSNVWNTGLPNSNIQFSDNRILTVNTNANLVLAPNGIGKVASNVDIVPNTANVFALGSPTRRWNTVYGQYLDLSHNAVIGGNLIVTGNLSAGNISYTSNVFVGDLEGSVFDGASSIVLDVIDSAIYVDNYRYANGVPVTFGGVAGGANTQIQFNDGGSFGGQAGFAFIKTTGNLTVPGNIINNTNSTANLGSPLFRWNYLYTSNVSSSNNISAAGNITANGNITAFGDIFANNASVSNITSSNSIYSVVGTFSGEDETGNDSLYVGAPTFTTLGTDIMAQFTGNVTNYGQINFQNYSNSVTASGDYIITADNGNDSTHYIDMGMTSSTWDGSQTNVLEGLSPNNGYLYVQDGNLTLGTRNDNTSYTWTLDTDGRMTIPGIIFSSNTIEINNQATSNTADIRLNSADDIFLQGRDKPDDLESEGGDINIYAGQGAAAATSGFGTGGGGDVQIRGGAGGVGDVSGSSGASGGFVSINGGDGGPSLDSNAGGGGSVSISAGSAADPTSDPTLGGLGGDVTITAGTTTRVDEGGGAIILNTGGASGDGNGAAGYVEINIASSNVGPGGSWTFSGTGTTLNVPANAEIYGANFGNFTVGCAGNTIITSSDLGANVKNWVFGYTGDLTVPGNIQTPTTGFPFTSDIANIDLSTLPDVYVELVDNEFGSDVTGQVTITDVVGTTQANGTWYFQAAESNYIQLYNDAGLTSPVNGNTWTAYESGGLAVAAGYNNLSITGGNVNIVTNTGDTWVFTDQGGTIFPTLSVTRGDRTGTLSGQTLLFGDDSQEAIISTPDGNANVNSSSQRFVINPGKGADGTTGEGGDIYLYAGRGGDAGGSGGDIKIRGGLAPLNGAGGYITMEGGEASADGAGGYIEIFGGYSGNGTGGYLDIRGGFGQIDGGDANIQGGQGQSGIGGDVNINGGVSGIGLAEYGNININSGASTWRFNNTGNLVLPNDGVVYETNIPFGGLSGKTIALKPYGGTDADQQLLVYPTAGADFNHLHLTTGNLWNTEMFLGNDDFYVKLANTGNIVINSNNNVGNTAQWTFGTAGTILNSGNLTIQTPSGTPDGVADWNGGGGWNQSSYTNLATTGGTGTGLTVNVAAGGGGYISINEITINTPGSGYTNGDVITIENENNLTGTFVISVSTNSWTLDTVGNLTVAGSIIMPPNSSLVGSGSSPAPSISGFGSISSANVVTGFISLDSGRINGGTDAVVTDGINSIASAPGAQMDVYGFPFSGAGVRGQLTITDVTTPSEANGTWYYQSLNTTTYQIYTNSTYSTLVDASGWSAYTGSGSVAITYQDPAANIVINSNGYFSTFGNDGTLGLPGDLDVAGNITGNTAGYAIGYRDIPQVSFAGDTTIATTDAGKHYYSVLSTGNVLTIANNASQGFQVGAAITVVNQGTGNITIAQGSGVTLYMAGNATSGNRSVATFGMATIMKVATDTWFVSGVGVA